MSDSSAPRRRRPRPAEMRRAALDGIGERLGEHLPPPIPPGLGEGLLDRARETASMPNPQLEGLIGRLLERCEMNGKQLEAVDRKMDRLEEKLEGVAYRRDIETFMPRDEIERRIDRAATEAKGTAEERSKELRNQVKDLRDLVRWGGGGLITAFLGLLLKMILASAHITT